MNLEDATRIALLPPVYFRNSVEIDDGGQGQGWHAKSLPRSVAVLPVCVVAIFQSASLSFRRCIVLYTVAVSRANTHGTSAVLLWQESSDPHLG